jgi:uncharacterized membrane protein
LKSRTSLHHALAVYFANEKVYDQLQEVMTTGFDPTRNTRRVLGLVFAGAGIAHFAHREFFNQLVPKSLADYATTINVVTGIIQISGAVALFIPRLQNVARWSNLALLVPTLPAAINQVLHPESLEKVGIPPQLAIVRVFAQLCVIGVVWRATRAVVNTDLNLLGNKC